jgi:hypothetical protein
MPKYTSLGRAFWDARSVRQMVRRLACRVVVQTLHAVTESLVDNEGPATRHPRSPGPTDFGQGFTTLYDPESKKATPQAKPVIAERQMKLTRQE